MIRPVGVHEGSPAERYPSSAFTIEQRNELERVAWLKDPHELRELLESALASKAEAGRGWSAWFVALSRAVTDRIAELQAPQAGEVFVELLGHSDRRVREAAASTLVAEGTEIAPLGPALVGALRHGDANVRRVVGWALGSKKYEPAKRELIAMLERAGAADRIFIAQALAEFGDEEADRALREARRREWRPWVRFSLPRR